MEVIPEIVRQFVADHIHSIAILEILLLLQHEPRQEWGSRAVTEALRLERTSVEARLEQLSSAGLLTSRHVGAERVYSYRPSTAEFATAVRQLARWYSSHRVAIITLVFSNPLEGIHGYPDIPGGRGPRS